MAKKPQNMWEAAWLETIGGSDAEKVAHFEATIEKHLRGMHEAIWNTIDYLPGSVTTVYFAENVNISHVAVLQRIMKRVGKITCTYREVNAEPEHLRNHGYLFQMWWGKFANEE